MGSRASSDRGRQEDRVLQRRPSAFLTSIFELLVRVDSASLWDRVMTPSTLIAVIDDDESVRESLPDLLRELGYRARAFASADQFLAPDCILSTQCLILDIAMPGMSGPELQQELIRRGHTTPIIFITALADKGVRSALLPSTGACLSKPFSELELREALAAALPGV